MKNHLAGLFLLIAAGPAFSAPLPLALDEGSVLWIEGDSTLHPYSSTSTALGLTMTLDQEKDETAAAAAKRKKPAALTLTVPVSSLKSAHKQLDKNLQKALEADKNPEISFVLESYEVPAETPASVLAKGKLSIAGKSKDVVVVGGLSEKDGRLVVEGRHELLMTDFGVKPPKMMMGAIKTADKVTVKFKLLLGAGK